jgi:hypothetical protein
MHYIFRDLTAQISGEQYITGSTALCYFSLASCYAFPSGIHFYLGTHLIKTLSLRSSINVTGQVSHPCNTTGKVTVLDCCILKESVSYPYVMILLCICILCFCPSTYPLGHASSSWWMMEETKCTQNVQHFNRWCFSLYLSKDNGLHNQPRNPVTYMQTWHNQVCFYKLSAFYECLN